VGFDVVPSDCLAKKLAEALPGAESLELAFSFGGAISRGTALTMWEHASSGGRARIDGQIVRVKHGWKVKDIPFKSKTRPAMTIPWGDVASAWHTTGIPNIAVYAALPRGQIRLARWFGWMSKLSAVPPISSLGRWLIGRRFRGPDEAARQKGRVEFWGRAEKKSGEHVEATMQTPDGYALTVQTAVECLRRALAGETSPGFHTPAGAFGADFIQQFPGVEIELRNTERGEEGGGRGEKEPK
jgi:saccharopine dehydrogenase (NAD+, L-lysine-forming)